MHQKGRKTMKKSSMGLALIYALGFLCLSLFGFTGFAQAKTFRYAAHGSPKGVRAEAVKWWAKEVEKQTQGKIKIKFFWSGSLLKPGDAMEGIGRGTANVGGGWGIYHPAKTPLWTVADPPFSHSDPYVGLKTMQEMYKTFKPMQEELAKYNVKLLAPFASGMTQLGTGKGVKPILTPADAEGLKVRFAGGQWAKFWQSCQAVPVKLTQGEVYEGLMRGTVDATQSYFFILEAYKHWDVIKNYSVVNAGELCSYGLIINLDDWSELSPEMQKILAKVSDEFVLKYAKGLIDNRKRIRKLGKEKGMVFHDLTNEQKSKWQKKAAPLMAKWVEFMNERGLPGTEAQNMFIKLRDKYAKQIAQKGYPWESK
jgi:TRAP-type C4-dicarboxylate transport system substrate-binding protein